MKQFFLAVQILLLLTSSAASFSLLAMNGGTVVTANRQRRGRQPASLVQPLSVSATTHPLLPQTADAEAAQRSAADAEALNALRRGEQPLVCLLNAVSATDISSWQRDAVALKSAGFGATASVVTKHTAAASAVRAGVHQTWLQSPRTAPLGAVVGELDGRRRLFRFIETLRRQLSEVDARYPPLPPDSVELSYLIYDANGAYYKTHVDAPRRQHQRRAVSFLLYLGSNDDSDAREWDCATDGGALRIHGAEFVRWCAPATDGDCAIGAAPVPFLPAGSNPAGDDDVYCDIAPTPGTMLLFDSATVPHEVRPTARGRVCVVGWFGATVD